MRRFSCWKRSIFSTKKKPDLYYLVLLFSTKNLKGFSSNEQWVAEVIAGNVGITRWSLRAHVKVCRWKTSFVNIRGEEFHRVGRTLFINLKNACFSLYVQCTLMISTQIVKISTFFSRSFISFQDNNSYSSDILKIYLEKCNVRRKNAVFLMNNR